MPNKSLSIPKKFPQDRLAAARLYHGQFGWAVHALFGPKERVNSPGKQPVNKKGWPKWTAEQVTDEYLQEHFGSGSARNVGCVIRPPHVVVDLDSKADDGASVREWLDQQSALQNVPRERTGGGAHRRCCAQAVLRTDYMYMVLIICCFFSCRFWFEGGLSEV